MAKRFINMGSIEQFRNIVGNVKHMSQYQGCDSDGNPVMDETITLPTITAIDYFIQTLNEGL